MRVVHLYPALWGTGALVNEFHRQQSVKLLSISEHSLWSEQPESVATQCCGLAWDRWHPSNILDPLREHAGHFRHKAVEAVIRAVLVVAPVQQNLGGHVIRRNSTMHASAKCGFGAKACSLRLRRNGPSLCKSTTMLPSYSTNQCQVPDSLTRAACIKNTYINQIFCR